jgi:hypothetical protein
MQISNLQGATILHGINRIIQAHFYHASISEIWGMHSTKVRNLSARNQINPGSSSNVAYRCKIVAAR